MQDYCYETYHSVPCFSLKGQIQDFLEPSSVNLHTVLVLVNAIYFKGIWKTAFKEEDTREVPFNVTEVGGHGHSFWPAVYLLYLQFCCHWLGDLPGSLAVRFTKAVSDRAHQQMRQKWSHRSSPKAA